MEKIKYIVGNKEHAQDIKNYFSSIGCEGVSFEFSDNAYFVNPDTKYVDFLRSSGWQFKALVEAGVFEELKYPYDSAASAPKPKLKVIQGIPNRGQDVIKFLESLGGVNTERLGGYVGDSYYFIDDDGCINCENMTSKFFNKFDLELLHLPEKSDECAVFKFPDKESMILEPFVTRILVRNDKRDRWIAGIFANKYDGVPCVNIAGSAIDYLEWIPYEGNEHLAFTNKDVRIE